MNSFSDVVDFYTSIVNMYGKEELLADSSDLSFVGTINFCENDAQSLLGGAILSVDNSVTIFGNAMAHFENNTAFHGGAMFLNGTSKLILSQATNITFIQNHANGTGGALYIKDSHAVFIWINHSYRMLSFHL